jgi:hypothetical protein
MRTQLTASKTPAHIGRTAAAGHGRAGGAWHRIGAVIRDMNYAAGRIAELNRTGR